jgi:predicted metalloprotease
MRWRGRRQSANVEDRRRISPGGMAVGGGAGALLLIVATLLFGGDPSVILDQLAESPGTVAQAPSGEVSAQSDEEREFVAVVLADTEEVWAALFRAMGREYRVPTLVLFTGQVQSACGFASAAVGPFYCPGDENVYIDLAFFRELRDRFGAPGDFAQAYVIAHEIGHHVQRQLGITGELEARQRHASPEVANELSVRLELQADFLAGVFAHHAERSWGILEAGDVEEALGAASAIGDDKIQMETQGRIVPDSFTHGTSAQRVRWFRRGLESGDLSLGDTFSDPDP